MSMDHRTKEVASAPIGQETTEDAAPSKVQIISQRKTQIGQVAVTFTVGRIRPNKD